MVAPTDLASQTTRLEIELEEIISWSQVHAQKLFLYAITARLAGANVRIALAHAVLLRAIGQRSISDVLTAARAVASTYLIQEPTDGQG